MRNLKRRRWLVLLSVVIGAVAVWASVTLVVGGEPGAEAQTGVTCQPTNPQPAQPLEMNTVVGAGVAKTVAMEKELFDCQDPTGATFSRDVETFVELIERPTATNVSTVARRVLVATCDKNFTPTGRVTCRTSSPTLGAAVTNPLLNCRPLPPTGAVKTPADPVEMNTVVLGDFVKTIKLEKEVLGCDTEIGDVYLFTEVLEKRTTTSVGFAPFATRFEGIMCLKDPSQGVITSCKRFTT